MTTEQKLYIPEGATSLATEGYLNQLRLGIQGPFGSGKTTAACTFPNPIVLSFNRGLIGQTGRTDVHEIKFYDDIFVDSICPKVSIQYIDFESQTQKPRPSNRKEALTIWLSKHGNKLSPQQTLIVDCGTDIQAAYHQWYKCNPRIAKTSGEEDKYAQWRWKIEYFSDLHIAIKGLTCNVVFIWHEAPDYNETGQVIGIRPLLTGQFQSELGTHYTDWFRALSIPKPTPDKMEDFKKKFQLSDEKAKEWIGSTKLPCQTIYIWQTQSDDKVNCKTSLLGAPKYVLAHSSSLAAFNRKA